MNQYQTLQFSSVYHVIKFARNWAVGVRITVNVVGVCASVRACVRVHVIIVASPVALNDDQRHGNLYQK